MVKGHMEVEGRHLLVTHRVILCEIQWETPLSHHQSVQEWRKWPGGKVLGILSFASFLEGKSERMVYFNIWEYDLSAIRFNKINSHFAVCF